MKILNLDSRWNALHARKKRENENFPFFEKTITPPFLDYPFLSRLINIALSIKDYTATILSHYSQWAFIEYIYIYVYINLLKHGTHTQFIDRQNIRSRIRTSIEILNPEKMKNLPFFVYNENFLLSANCFVII